MGASHIVQGWFVLDRHITIGDTGEVTVEAATAEALDQVVDRFSATLDATRPFVAAG